MKCINCGVDVAQLTAIDTGGVCEPCSLKELPAEIENSRLEMRLDGYDTESFFDEFRQRFYAPEILEKLPQKWISMLRNMIQDGDIRALLATFQNYNVIAFLIRSDYASKLTIKRRQLEYKDHYGDWNLDAWFEECDRFIEKRFRILQEAAEDIPESIMNLAVTAKLENYLLFDKLICLTLPIDDFTSSAICDMEEYEEANGVEKPRLSQEYEVFVGKSFKENGWQVQHVGGTGDQGADLLVTKDGTTAVVQCKFYQKPVGNSAVQEAHAAKLFYGVDAAIVVTSSDFTKSCRQLAESCKVLLMIVAIPSGESSTN